MMIRLRSPQTTLVRVGADASTVPGAPPLSAPKDLATAAATAACPPCVCPSTFWRDLFLVTVFGAASALGATLIGKVI